MLSFARKRISPEEKLLNNPYPLHRGHPEFFSQPSTCDALICMTRSFLGCPELVTFTIY